MASATRAFWVPSVNKPGRFPGQTFAEFSAGFEIEAGFGKLMDEFGAALPATAAQ